MGVVAGLLLRLGGLRDVVGRAGGGRGVRRQIYRRWCVGLLLLLSLGQKLGACCGLARLRRTRRAGGRLRAGFPASGLVLGIGRASSQVGWSGLGCRCSCSSFIRCCARCLPPLRAGMPVPPAAAGSVAAPGCWPAAGPCWTSGSGASDAPVVEEGRTPRPTAGRPCARSAAPAALGLLLGRLGALLRTAPASGRVLELFGGVSLQLLALHHVGGAVVHHDGRGGRQRAAIGLIPMARAGSRRAANSPLRGLRREA